VSAATLLVVDDEPRIRRVLQLALSDLGYRVLLAEDADAAQRQLAAGDVDLALVDLQLPGRSGLDLLAELRTGRPELPVILMTAFGTVESAVQAMKLGAFDYVLKPFSVDEIHTLTQRALGLRRAERELAYLREAEATSFEGIVAAAPAMRAVLATVERVAGATATVLVTGETGVGKELVARALHARSPRADRLFVAVNCAAIPGELLEAELFGVTRGAFTGALADRAGKFELADGGTLFLDEIGDMPLAMQAKLLRALQEGAIERLGSGAPRPVDVRVVAATHRDLQAMVADGSFRADLFYRLHVVPIAIPPLRDRREDIPVLARHLVERLGRHIGRPARLSDEAIDRLLAYDWPGNVRELANVLERAILLAPGELLAAADVPVGAAGSATPTGPAATGQAPGPPPPLRDVVERAEREAIREALRHTGGNKTRAAELLGVSIRTLWYKLEKLGLEPRP